MIHFHEELIRSSHGLVFQDVISENVSSIKGEFLVISMFCCRDDPSDLLKTCKQTIFGCICNFTSRYGRDSKVSISFYYSLSNKGRYQRFGNVAISALVHSLFENLKVTEITAKSVKKLVSYGSEVSPITYSIYPRVGH